MKAAARYTTKYLIFHLGGHPATPNASARRAACASGFCECTDLREIIFR